MDLKVRETAEARHLQHSRQELRSRQRTNYGVLISSLPLYQECVEVVMLLCALTTSTLRTAKLGKNIKWVLDGRSRINLVLDLLTLQVSQEGVAVF